MKIEQLFEQFKPLMLGAVNDYAKYFGNNVIITDVPNTLNNEQLSTLFKQSLNARTVKYGGDSWAFNVGHSEFFKSLHPMPSTTPHSITWMQFVDVCEVLGQPKDDFRE